MNAQNYSTASLIWMCFAVFVCAKSISYYARAILAISQHFGWFRFRVKFSLQMHTNGYAWASGQNSDTAIGFSESNFL